MQSDDWYALSTKTRDSMQAEQLMQDDHTSAVYLQHGLVQLAPAIAPTCCCDSGNLAYISLGVWLHTQHLGTACGPCDPACECHELIIVTETLITVFIAPTTGSWPFPAHEEVAVCRAP